MPASVVVVQAPERGHDLPDGVDIGRPDQPVTSTDRLVSR
jgi:hypothetical protein